MSKNKLPKFLFFYEEEIAVEAVEVLREQAINCLTILKNLSSYSKPELIALLILELQRKEPRRMVLDKVHARYCKLVRQGQCKELFECANLK